MEIIKGKHLGFCSGVKRAVETAKLIGKEGKAYTLGWLIHNKKVVDDLKAENIFPCDDIESLKEGDKLIISAHGADKSLVESLKAKGVEIIDATCPYVKKIHEKAEEYSGQGYHVIILGDAAHKEVKGIAGHCKDFQIASEISDINLDKTDKYFVVAQTTFPVEKYANICTYLANMCTTLSKTVVFFDSICYTTKERQDEAFSVSKLADTVLVIGDKSSSNTNKLLLIARENCSDAHLIENVTDLSSVNIKNKNAKLGLLSGASAPMELITEVLNTMNDAIINGDALESVTETKEETKTAEAPKAEKAFSMDEALKKYGPKTYREGMKLKATVVSADPNGITVSVVGVGKNDIGFIDKSEVELDGSYDYEQYKPNDELDVILIPKNNGDKSKSINLSKKAYDALKVDDEKVKGILAGEEFTLACTQEIKGGLLGKIGSYTVFVPASQIRIGFVQNIGEYVGKPLRLKALPPKEETVEDGKRPRNPKRIVASQRIILEEEKKAREDDFWASIPVGTIVHGKVKRFASFGAFVSLKYMDALVHNSELSWSKSKITNPEDILVLNNSYDFVVLSADRETGKISLGYKQLQPKPYELAAEKYPVGTITKGTVVRIAKFGVFVELEPGIDGLVHISQITHGWTKNASDALKVGQEVEVKVIKFENDKITLSIKELLPEEPQEEVAAPEKNEKRKPRRERTEFEEEPREYISQTTTATLADLFKDFNTEE